MICPAGAGASCAAARPCPPARGIPIAAPESTASDCLRFMVFACGACGGSIRGSLSPHNNFAAPRSELNAPEVQYENGKAVTRSLPHSHAMVHPAFTLSSAFWVCGDGWLIEGGKRPATVIFLVAVCGVGVPLVTLKMREKSDDSYAGRPSDGKQVSRHKFCDNH